MKKYILFLFVSFLICNASYAQISGNVNWVKDVDFFVQTNNEYTEVSVNTMDYTEEVGNPKIPYCVKSFVLPNDADILNIQITSISKYLIGEDVLVSPVQYPIPVGEKKPIWVKPNEDVYNSSEAFPGKYAEIISDREDFGYHIVSIRFYPLEYLPQKRELYLCDLSFSLEYSLNGLKTRISNHGEKSERLDQLDREYVKSIIDNVDMLNSQIQYLSPKSLLEDAIVPEYLIITNESLKSTFQLLIDWKTKKGVPAFIETVENIIELYKGCDTQEKIYNYLKDIKSKYGSLFVLLGGDTNIIPARMQSTRQGTENKWAAVDYYYACVGHGNWNANGNNVFFESEDFDSSSDWGLSFKLGRASVEDQAEAKIFVEKVIDYERCIGVTDTRYYNNTLIVDAFIGDGDCNGYLLYHDGKNALINNYNTYKNYVTGNAKSWFMYDDYLGNERLRCMYWPWKFVICDQKKNLSDPIPGGTCLSGNEELTSANFLGALNNGGNSNYGYFHIIYHMDHSSPTGMGASSLMKNQSIDKTKVDQVSNGKYSQIVMSGGCTPADITKDCIAEHFLNNFKGGAVAFIGNTDIGWASEYDQFRNFCEELYKTSSNVSNRYDLSMLHIKANGPLSKTQCSLHLLGDPEMQVWTEIPQNLDVSITPDLVHNGDVNVSISIKNLSVSQIATVCIQKVNEIYTVKTMQNGIQVFSVSPKTAGEIDITITAHNFRPFETTVPVNVSPNAVLHISDLIYDDDKQGESNGNGDKQLDAGEAIELAITLKNEGSVASNETVTGQLTCNAPGIELIKSTVTFDRINAGSSRASNTNVVFVIDKDCREYFKNSLDPMEFTLTILDGDHSMVEKFQVDIYAPEIQIGNQKVTWTSNGNTTVDPGETVKMNIDLTNISKAEATGLKAVLVSNNAQVSCSSTPIAYPDISASETKTNAVAFQFQTSSSYTGSPNFTLNVTNKYGKTWSFPVNPLSRPATVNVSTVNSQRYSSSISVYWTPIRNMAGYNIYRSDNGENGTYQKLNKHLLTAAYYLDENLAGCSVYHYKVTAISGNGNESGLSLAYRTWTSYPVVSPFPLRLTTGTYQTESCPSIADVDNDGKQEIFGISGSRSALTGYLLGFRPTGEELYNIDNNVTTVSGFAKMMTLSKGQVAFGDLYGKGEQNIVASTWNDGQRDKNGVCCYSAFDRNGDQNPDLLWETKIPFSFHQSPVVANLDGSIDGSMEVIIKSHQTSDIYILDNNGNELRRLNPNIADAKGMDYNYSALTVADLDNDGQMEIIASYNVLGIYIWRYDGTPFTENPFWGEGIAKLSSVPVVCDLNEDGKKELIFSQNNIAVSHVYAISLDGDKTVAGWNGSQTIPYTDNGSSLDHTLSVGDINNDGHLEVIILGHGVVKVWKHTGELIFSKEIEGLFPEIPYASNAATPILADVDGDAVPDIVFCSDRNIYALHNDGSEIVGFPIVSDENFQDTPCVADIDKDGKNELIANNKYDLYVWKTAGVPSAIEWSTKRGNSQNTGEYFSTVCEPMLITTDKVWDGESPCGNVVLQSGKLVIPAGKTMTLGTTSAIIVRAGATLEVDGGAIQEANIKAQDGSAIIIKNNGCIKLKKTAGLRMEKGAQLDYQHGKIDIAD